MVTSDRDQALLIRAALVVVDVVVIVRLEQEHCHHLHRTELGQQPTSFV